MAGPLPATAWCGWSFCNGARAPAGYPASPSPRMADCATAAGDGEWANAVADADNMLAPGDPIPGAAPPSADPDPDRVRPAGVGDERRPSGLRRQGGV
eukprot:gene22192-62414_t